MRGGQVQILGVIEITSLSRVSQQWCRTALGVEILVQRILLTKILGFRLEKGWNRREDTWSEWAGNMSDTVGNHCELLGEAGDG